MVSTQDGNPVAKLEPLFQAWLSHVTWVIQLRKGLRTSGCSSGTWWQRALGRAILVSLSLSKYLPVAPGFMAVAQFLPIVFRWPKAPTSPFRREPLKLRSCSLSQPQIPSLSSPWGFLFYWLWTQLGIYILGGYNISSILMCVEKKRGFPILTQCMTLTRSFWYDWLFIFEQDT